MMDFKEEIQEASVKNLRLMYCESGYQWWKVGIEYK